MQTICLSWIDPSTKERRRQVFGLPLTIGRAPANDIVLNDPQVSRKHAILQQEDQHIIISDLQSHNGIFVNGQRVRRAVLTDGAAVVIGSIHLSVKLEYVTRVVGGFDWQEDTVYHGACATATQRHGPLTGDQFFSTRPLPQHELNNDIAVHDIPDPTEGKNTAISGIGWGKGRVTAIAWSPEGRTLAVASTLGVYLHDAKTLDQQQFYPTEMPIEQIAFLEQGSVLAAASERAIERWRVQDGAPIGTTIAIPSSAARAFAPDGETVVLDMGKALHLYRVGDGQLLLALPVEVAYPQCGIAYTQDGQTLAVAVEGMIQLWNLRQGRLLHTIKMSNPSLISLAISPDGQMLAIASETAISVWRVRHCELLYTIELNYAAISRITFAADGRSIATITDNGVRIWRATDGVPLRTLRGYATRSVDIAFAPDSGTLAVTSAEAVHIWRIDDGALLCVLDGYMDCVQSIAFAPDSQTLAATSGLVRLWRIHDGTLVLIHTFDQSFPSANGVAFAPDGYSLATTSNEQIDLWRAHDGTHIQTLPGHSIQADSVVFTDDGQSLLTVTAEAVELLHADGSEPHKIRPEGKDEVYDVAFASRGQVMATVSGESVQLWSTSDGNLLFRLIAKMDIASVALDPDGQFLTIASEDAIQLWQSREHEHCYTLEQGAHHLVFSSDGALFASAKGKTIHLWRTSDGVLLQTLSGHTAGINCLAFAQQGQFLVSGAQDGTIRLWEW
jgi:WD40 repeat protein